MGYAHAVTSAAHRIRAIQKKGGKGEAAAQRREMSKSKKRVKIKRPAVKMGY